MAFDVLIVDDSAAIRKILQRMLRQTDVALGKILEAGDGAEAVERLKAESVNLILSDINMPNMDGLQLLSQVRGHPAWKAIPVIMITTEGGEAKVMEAVQLGANGYVRKPFTAEQIKAKLDALA
jgi:two-component system chemotaxis response regulator CheY